MARAATSLRQMVSDQVLLSVPSVEIMTRQEAITLVSKAENPRLVAIRQDFSGPLSGRALLIFPEAGSLELVRLVVGKQLAIEDIIDLEDEALAETGNIILNSWVATIANLLKHGLKMSLPVVMRGPNVDIFNITLSTESLVLFLHIRFEVSNHQINGYVALLMDIPTLDDFRRLIADYIASVAR
jgi:chemotaxis protein CheC